MALGGNTFGWTADEQVSFDILDDFTAGGGNMIDTADSYSAFAPGNSGGESETIIGKWQRARDIREHIVLATKVSRHPDFRGLAPANIRAAAEASLTRLQTDHIDLYYAHYDDPDVPLEESLAAFDQLIDDGLVRYVGISNYTPERVQEWLDVAERNGFRRPIALQPEYNLVHRARYEKAYAPLALANHLAVFPYYSLAAGFLTGKYHSPADAGGRQRGRMVEKYMTDAGFAVVEELETVARAHDVETATVALAWLLTRHGVTAPLASASRTDQMPSLMDAPSVVLTSDELGRLDALSTAVHG
nr:aldo/keto reductase [Rhodococcus sp. HNM0569]